MAQGLRRLARIRVLQEEIAAGELAAEAARLLELERRSTAAAGDARQSREAWVAAVLRLPPSGALPGMPGSPEAGEGMKAGRSLPETADRRCEEAGWELAVGRRRAADAGWPAQRTRVESAREKFLIRRRDRLQVEALLEAAAAARALAERRREQRRLDDWFQGRPRKAAGKTEAPG